MRASSCSSTSGWTPSPSGAAASLSSSKEGQTVRAGTPLLRVDLDVIRAAGLSTESAVIVTNADDLPALHLTAGGIVSTGTPLFKFE